MDVIKSRDNRLLKHFRKLNNKKYRQESHQYTIEGIRMVEEAVKSKAPIKYCLCSDTLNNVRGKVLAEDMVLQNIGVYYVEERLFMEICDTDTPQGIAAVVEMMDYSIDSVLYNSDFLVVVDRIQDPGNLGAIIRTSDAAGAHGVLMWEGTVDPYSPKVLRSTMGSIFHIPILEFENEDDAIARLKERGFTVYASSLMGSSPYFTEDYKRKAAIVIGNEANGISNGIISSADRLINIPMPGNAESLNAAVAAGILIFEMVRQRLHVDK